MLPLVPAKVKTSRCPPHAAGEKQRAGRCWAVGATYSESSVSPRSFSKRSEGARPPIFATQVSLPQVMRASVSPREISGVAGAGSSRA